MIQNPFIKNAEVLYKRSITKKFIIDRYEKSYDIDVSTILDSCGKIDIYECQQSGFRFYYPFTIAGDSKFYEQLQKYDWYYMPWKWEHDIFSKYIKENDQVLEVGCGKGAFIKQINSQFQNVKCVGLELNESSTYKGNNCEILNEYVEDFCIDNFELFDAVCSFQVLEHISAVDAFLKSSIKCLKEDGLLAIGVPNNDGFIKYNQEDILNMPPHHMCLWNEKSLRAIASCHEVELVEILYEPLQELHFPYYTQLYLKRILGKKLAKIPLKLISFLGLKGIIAKKLKSRSHKINGHTILAIFKKTSSLNTK